DRIVEPTLAGLFKSTAEPYRGVLYVGLALTEEGPKVVEFNCRFGDPETQVVLPRLAADLTDLLGASTGGGLGQRRVAWLPAAAVPVAVPARGYPGAAGT